MPCEIAAAFGAVMAWEEDPARPLNTLELKKITVPAINDRLSKNEQESELHNGVTPLDTPLTASAGMRTPFRFSTRVSRLRPLAAGEGVGYDYTWRAPEGGALLATLPVGYADGYKRCLSNVASVVVRGVRAPVVGLVCMDQCTVDVSAVPGVIEGDEAILLGGDSPDRPDQGIPVLEMASWAATNRNDVICSIGRRVPRVYSEGGRVVAETDYVMGGNA